MDRIRGLKGKKSLSRYPVYVEDAKYSKQKLVSESSSILEKF